MLHAVFSTDFNMSAIFCDSVIFAKREIKTKVWKNTEMIWAVVASTVKILALFLTFDHKILSEGSRKAAQHTRDMKHAHVYFAACCF